MASAAPEGQATLPAEDSEAQSDEPEQRSALDLLRGVLVSMTELVEDGTELLGATLREELAEFRDDTVRRVMGMAAILAGTGLLIAGLTAFLSDLLASVPLALLIVGGLLTLLGVVIQTRGNDRHGGGREERRD